MNSVLSNQMISTVRLIRFKREGGGRLESNEGRPFEAATRSRLFSSRLYLIVQRLSGRNEAIRGGRPSKSSSKRGWEPLVADLSSGDRVALNIL